MRSDRELLEHALSKMEFGCRSGEALVVMEEIRARLAEPEPEFVRLSDKELQICCLSHGVSASRLLFDVAKDIEDALLEKNR